MRHKLRKEVSGLVAAIVVLFVVALAYSPHSKINVGPPASVQEKFIRFMLPRVEAYNKIIYRQHKLLVKLYYQHKRGFELDNQQQGWVLSLARAYQISAFDFSSHADWIALMKRVDIVPNSLVIAQAINESAWGKSRFARDGNNYFGQWCQTQGCGLVPKRRAVGATHEVKVFLSPQDSVNAYFQNINTNRAYKDFRDLRFKLRLEGKSLDSLVLIHGLAYYSQKGKLYISLLSKIIRGFDLQRFDDRVELIS